MKAIYCEITKLGEHGNAHSLQVATLYGYPVIVGKDARKGDIGLFIQEGSQLSESFALAHGLLAKHPTTGEKLGGYLRSNRKVSAVTLRGRDSMGIFIPMEIEGVELGDEIDTLPGESDPFVGKYETPAQLARKGVATGEKIKGQKHRLPAPVGFDAHYSTPHLNRSVWSLVFAPRVVVTEKLHGTSGRTGMAEIEVDRGPLRSWLSRKMPRLFPRQYRRAVVSGSRSLHFAYKPTPEGYRQVIHDALAPWVKNGETWYYEIVGFSDRGKPIMPSHGGMRFSYGCEPLPNTPPREQLGRAFKIYVYRIVSGGRELGYDKIAARIEDIRREAADLETLDALDDPHPSKWLAPVPFLDNWLDTDGDGFDHEDLIELGSRHCVGRSTLDPSHIREGSTLRGESLDGFAITKAMKRKSHAFVSGEGVLADDPNSIDPEAIS